MLKTERLDIVVIAGASLGVLCGAGLALVSGPLECLTLVPLVTCLIAAVASHSGRTRLQRKVLAELQEHRAAFGSSSDSSLTVASAARALVDTAERAVADSAAKVADLQTQLAALASPPRTAATADVAPSEFKNAFVTKVSHELRTPLAGIKAYVELLIDGEAQNDRTRLEFYEVIHGEADRLSRLVDDIVAISRIEAGVAKPQKAPVSVSKLMEAALVRVTPDLRHKNLTVSRIDPDADYQTDGDASMLEAALVTLLFNAVKFSPTGGGINVEIGTNPHEKTVLVRILDQGPRVEPQDVPGLFDKFGGARICARTAGGAGVALALVRQIIETVHGGSVFVESRQGRGSCFGFSVPLYAREPSRLQTAGELCIR